MRKVIPVALVATLALMASSCALPLMSVRDNGGADALSVRTHHCATPVGDRDFGHADPGEVSVDRVALGKAIHYATERGAQSVRVYRHGCLIGRSGNDPGTERQRFEGWSMTKGVVSTVVGRAVQMGYVDLDATVGDYLSGLDPEHSAITIREMLTQTSGLRMAWINDLWAAANADSAKLTLRRPFEAEPGTKFLYAQTTMTVLVAIVEAAVGEDFQAFARRELFHRIGITDGQWRWARDGSGHTQGFAFLDMAPLAWSRLGHLLLEGGNWNGVQLLDPDYVAEGQLGSSANPGYGFMWWTNRGDWHVNSGFPAYERTDTPNWPGLPRDAFAFSGLFDQEMTVIPSLDMVVLRMGLPAEVFPDPLGESPGIRPDFQWRFNRLLMRAITDVGVPDPGRWVYPGKAPDVDVFHLVDLSLSPFAAAGGHPAPAASG